MTELETTTTVPTPAPKATPKPKAKVTKPAAKPVKATKPAPKADPVPKVKSPVTKPQLRILEALAKAGKGLNATTISDKAGVAKTWVTGFVRKACAANTTPSLMEQGLVKGKEVDVDGHLEWVYEVTAAGRKMATKK